MKYNYDSNGKLQTKMTIAFAIFWVCAVVASLVGVASFWGLVIYILYQVAVRLS